MTATATRVDKNDVYKWLLELDHDEYAYAYDQLSTDEKKELDAWLDRRESAKTVFDQLGYEPFERQLQLHALQPWSMGGPWDVLYGGAAGPGKTVGLLADAIGWAWRFPGLKAWCVRATFPELRDSFLAELEARFLFGRSIGARWTKGDRTLRLPNGSQVIFHHARNIEEANKKLSAQCQLLVVDERTQMEADVIDKLASRIRSGDPDIPVVGIRSGSNPGGRSHGPVKQKFIDPAPKGNVRIRTVLPSGKPADAYFLPGLPGDNPNLDDDYYDRLSLLPPDLQYAYRHGDWSKFVGMAFKEWYSDIHVVEPEDYPLNPGMLRAVGVDYGLDAPFAALWGAKFPDNLIVIYRELYQADLTPTQQAELILASEAEGERAKGNRRSVPVFLDPSCWARQPDSPKPIDGQPPKGSIADDYKKAGLPVFRAYNDRIGGKRLIHAGLRPSKNDGKPRLLIYSTCTNLIRTLPNLPISKTNPEDVDTHAEDHCFAAGTPITTSQGIVPIEKMKVGDHVQTRSGLGRVVAAGMTGKSRPVVAVRLRDGRELTMTPNHRVLTERGWITARSLTHCDTLVEWIPSSSPTRFRNMRASVGIGAGCTSSTPEKVVFTDEFGLTITDLSRPSTISTMKTKTDRITQSPTSFSRNRGNTSVTTAATLPMLLVRHAAVILVERVKAIVGLPRTNGAGLRRRDGNRRSVAPLNAKSATIPLRQRFPNEPDSVREDVRRPTSVVSVEQVGRTDVYNLTVLGRPEFVANGIIVHNCYDGLRYLLGGMVGKTRTKVRTHGAALQSTRSGV